MMAEDKPCSSSSNCDKRMWRENFSRSATDLQIPLSAIVAMSSSYFEYGYNPNQNTNFSSGQSSFNGGSELQSLAMPSPVQIEGLSLAEVMKNPIVQRMYNSLQDATDKVMQSVQIQQNLYQENSRLNAEVKELQKVRQLSL
jgi:hypothetical protein